MKLDHDFLDAFHRLGAKPGEEFGAPPSRKAALLVRPTMIAKPGKTLVWSDWSAIEARVLPWLAASRSADKVLDIFRHNDADPNAPDIYMVEAANTYATTPEDIKERYDAGDKFAIEQRQIGKVEVLSLGFGGSVGAFLAMAVNYGVYVDPVRAQELVDMWRANNPWARQFWGAHNRNESYGLWGAALSAMEEPDTIFTAGRVAYVFDKSYMKGTLFCALPCGRLLSYPSMKWEVREVEDKRTGQLVERNQLTFRKGYNRVPVWYGRFAENITQGLAGSILRKTLERLEYDSDPIEGRYTEFMPVVGHTHDEIVTNPLEADAELVDELLTALMVRGFDWSEGLPLAAETTTNWYYSKSKVR